MITYINPDAIEDQSIDWSKLKNVPDFPSGGESGNSIPPMINVTYAELKDLRDNAELVPGQQYRITDYVTTVNQTNAKSANCPFDIIVTADDESALNEKARAIQHEGDTYFAKQKLNAWELWYCLDNDTERFVWANSLEDDTESILQTIKPASGVSASGKYIYNAPITKIVFNGVTYNPEIGVRTMINSGPPVYITKIDERTLFVEDANGYVTSNEISVYGIVYAGKGVIYRMIDENYNDCPYDFKNVMFRHPRNIITYPDYYYTFTLLSSGAMGIMGAMADYSLLGDYCRNNTIKDYCVNNNGVVKTKLNNTVFINTLIASNCYNNSFGNNCYNNSFGNNCYNNSFGNNCYNNSFGDKCYNNSFENSCYSNTLENECSNNSFGNDCHEIFFGDLCSNNSFVGSFSDESFGDNITNRAYFSGKVYATGGFYEE